MSSIANAQDDQRREAAIDKLIQVQAETANSFLDDSTLEMLMFRFRKVNTGVSEDIWHQIKIDVKLSLFKILTERNGPFALSVREIMPQFTTDEIDKLIAIYSDPLFIKYSDTALATMRKPNTILAIRIAIERSVVEMNDSVIKRGLKPAY
ncbi:MAG: hypothetical protein PHY62_09280 [Gallionella sp.]|nr:hypothetical protein [Gallionella sp.]